MIHLKGYLIKTIFFFKPNQYFFFATHVSEHCYRIKNVAVLKQIVFNQCMLNVYADQIVDMSTVK